MSSAIVLVGSRQVIPLASRLIVGIRLQGTIGFVDPASPYVVKPRPYASYLATTLRRLQCAVALFVPTNTEHDREMMNMFYRRDFPVSFRYVNDHSKFIGAGSGRGNRKRGMAPNNYTEYLRIMANEANGTGQDTSRVLFIDSEVNYRFTPVQTIVLDAYEPLTRRQQRRLVQQQYSNPFGDVSSRNARRYGAAAARARKMTVRHRAVVSAQHLQDAVDMQQKYTDFLIAEQEGVQLPPEMRNGVQDGHGGDLCHFSKRHPQRSAPSSSSPPHPQQGGSTRGRVSGPLSTPGPSSLADTESDKTPPDGNKDIKEEQQQLSMSCALAVNLEDYSLVALAEMIAEMSASETSVADYIKTEPLIEKVEVPFHGKANYLAPENCDNIDLLNWDEIQVLEKAHGTGVPEMVEETEDHKDFFR
ncbi:conserved hypothetical protein [Leishmania major strain Friedlin]|uniref:Uncharacterized protein n=1 Tax=Leishmania major TaxID=5664 RepID=Q4QHX3_LEIMA|nr:conserved hypothetical protein [Leishmania major strain Friedlin]CAG9569666.1 hypothetical_protein_-__conserved [Leishmania major strain Friedlin]CAJ02545.1 conserved hypothetical protein [Leishmania major strain Friedlin]|eukprot:XP_001681225.1 conserved hypothetical protein [Leishmania major strain Friedlin]